MLLTTNKEYSIILETLRYLEINLNESIKGTLHQNIVSCMLYDFNYNPLNVKNLAIIWIFFLK